MYAGSNTYAALGRQNTNTNQMQATNAQMQANLANIQLQKLKEAYPGVEFLKTTAAGQEYRVPLKLAVSPTPLYIKVSLPQQFPYQRPMILVMARVTHKSIDSATYQYKGQMIQGWSENSQLAMLVQAIEREFNEFPPLPQHMQQPGMQNVRPNQIPSQINPQQQQMQQSNNVQMQQQMFQEKDTRYTGEVVNLPKPMLQQLKQSIQTKDAQSLESMMEYKKLKAEYQSQPEVQAIGETIKKLRSDVESQLEENFREKQQLETMFNNFEAQNMAFYSLKDQNQILMAQKSSISAGLSKDTILMAMTQKANSLEDQSKQTEKKFLKQDDLDMKQFMQQYINQRKEYHKTSLLKVKVQQC